MEESQWRSELHRLGLTPSMACLSINLMTGALIDPKDTVRQFQRKGLLSQRESAMWQLFFKVYRRRKRKATTNENQAA